MSTAQHTVSPDEVMAFLDGELAQDKANAVSQHLEECPECAYVAEQFRETSRTLAGWSIEALPADVEESIIEVTKKPRAALFSITRKPWVLGCGAAAAVLFAFLSVRHSVNHREEKMMSYTRPESTEDNRALDSKGSEARSLAQASTEMARFAPPPPPSGRHSYPADKFGLRDKTVGGEATHDADTSSSPMIARSAAITVQVTDFGASRTAVDAILIRYRGYAATLTANTPEGSARSLQASLRVPAPQLAAALAEFKHLGRVQSETQSGEEVTQQHADLVARLKNSRETEERLQAILQQRTGKIEDVLQVEEEIARVRGEIEGMEAEQQALEHRVSFASVDLQLVEEYKEPLTAPDHSTSTRIRNALVSGWRNAADFVLAVALFAAESGPTLLVLAIFPGLPALLLWRRYRRLRRVL